MNENLGIADALKANRLKYAWKRYIAPHDRVFHDPAPMVEKPAPVAPERPLPRKKRLYGPGTILNATAEAFGITVHQLLTKSTLHRIARPRFAAALLLRESKWKLSFPEISRVLKHADHTTAWHAVNRARELLTTDPEWAERYHAAERLLKGEK